MITRRRSQGLLILGALLAGACADSDPTAPIADQVALTQEDQLSLEVLADLQATEAPLAAVDVSQTAAARHGPGPHGSATQLAQEARVRFRAAYDALMVGERTRAAEEARIARRLVAQAMERAEGPRAYASLVEQAEALALTVAQEPEEYVDAGPLQVELAGLAQQARIRLSQGDAAAAGAMGVLAQQRHQQRRHPGNDHGDRLERARFHVALAGTAVALATRIIEARPVNDEQNRYLAAAREYLGAAQKALEEGYPRRAMYLAQQAHWTSLKAVILPGGVTMEEARAMAELAEGLYQEAAATVGPDATEFRKLLLKRARHLIDVGLEKLEAGNLRGIGALWRAAVVCSWLIG